MFTILQGIPVWADILHMLWLVGDDSGKAPWVARPPSKSAMFLPHRLFMELKVYLSLSIQTYTIHLVVYAYLFAVSLFESQPQWKRRGTSLKSFFCRILCDLIKVACERYLNVQTAWNRDHAHIIVLPFASSKRNHRSVSFAATAVQSLAEIAVEEQPLEEALPSEANGPSKRQGLVKVTREAKEVNFGPCRDYHTVYLVYIYI